MGFRLLQITCRDVTLWRLYQQTSHCGVSTPNRRHIVASLPTDVTLWRLYEPRHTVAFLPNRRHIVASLPQTVTLWRLYETRHREFRGQFFDF